MDAMTTLVTDEHCIIWNFAFLARLAAVTVLPTGPRVKDGTCGNEKFARLSVMHVPMRMIDDSIAYEQVEITLDRR